MSDDGQRSYARRVAPGEPIRLAEIDPADAAGLDIVRMTTPPLPLGPLASGER